MPIVLTGPHLNAALICERVLTEADGVLSVVRIIDRFIVTGNAPDMQPTNLPFSILIMLKSGTFRGRSKVTLSATTPSGVQLPTIDFPVNFEGDDDRGINLVASVALPAQEVGLYWFTVLHLDQPLTAVPLRVLYQGRGIAQGV